MPVDPSRRLPLVLLGLVLLGLGWSATGPADRFTWFMEVLPVLGALPLLALTARRFPLTPLVYVFIALHAFILMTGGRYTYANVPLGDWVRDLLGLSRNPYDRLGHLAQGFVPALVVREFLLRRSPLRPGGLLVFLVFSVCLAISALYELLEWWTALATGEGASAFLGTQGDVWDTQWDMCLAGCGALVAQLLLSRLQDRQLKELLGTPA